MKSSLLIAAGALAAVALTASAEAQTARFKGTVGVGPLPWCYSAGGYNITGTNPTPPPGACISGTGTRNPDMLSPCPGRGLVAVKWRRARGCR